MMDRSTRFAWICITRGVVLATLVVLAATAGRADDGEALPPLVPIRDLLAVGEMGRKDLARVHDFEIEDRGAFE